MNVDALAAALNATDQALAAARDGRDELHKLQSDKRGAASLRKMADQLQTIRANIATIHESARQEAGMTSPRRLQ